MNAPDSHSPRPAPRRLLAIFAAAFVPGMVIGWFLANPDDADSRVAVESIRETTAPLRVETREPRDHEPMRAPPRAPTSAEIIERFLDKADAQDMFAVPAATLGRLRPIRNGRLSPDMADLLALSPEEIEAVDRVFANTETRLNESELARVEILSASDDEVVLRIPGDPEEAGQIRDAFRNGFIEVLGDADGQLLLSAMDSARWYDLHFQTFGAIDRYASFAVERGPGDRISVEFKNESPFDQKMIHGGTSYFINEDSPQMATWSGFKTTLHPDLPITSTVGRSRYLLPILPEEIRSVFEAIEEQSEEHRTRKSGASN